MVNAAISQISAHPLVRAQSKVQRPWALFREITVYALYICTCTHNCRENSVVNAWAAVMAAVMAAVSENGPSGSSERCTAPSHGQLQGNARSTHFVLQLSPHLVSVMAAKRRTMGNASFV